MRKGWELALRILFMIFVAIGCGGYLFAYSVNSTILDTQIEVLESSRDAMLDMCPHASSPSICASEAYAFFGRNLPTIWHYVVPFSYAGHDIR